MNESQLFLLYIDAGTAGYIIQMTAAAVGGAIVYGLIFWRRVSSKITSIFSRSKSHPPTLDENTIRHKDTTDITGID